MRKSIALLLMACTLSIAGFAQQHEVEKKDKVRKTATFKQRVHNVFHKHKHYNGYKVKHVTKVENDKH